MSSQQHKSINWIRNLTAFAVLLALTVVLLGAYTRLKDAGLGCPDWPGCYGQLTVPSATHHVAQANIDFPGRELEPAKAWAEMIHRYFASSLGLVILVIAGLSLNARKQRQNYSPKLPLFLVLLVIFQGLLGMWTVTMKLNPAVVTSHLLGGMTTFSLLFAWLLYNQNQLTPFQIDRQSACIFKKSAGIGLVIVVIQIALGAWTSSNYSAMVCTGLPLCQGDWWQHLKPLEAFQLWGHGAINYEYGVKSLEARTTIHVLHRIWAVVTALTVIGLAWRLFRSSSEWLKKAAIGLAVLVITQFLLGVSNIIFHLPLAIAVAHNGGGALLFATLVGLNTALYLARHRSNGGVHDE